MVLQCPECMIPLRSHRFLSARMLIYTVAMIHPIVVVVALPVPAAAGAEDLPRLVREAEAGVR